MSIYEYWIGKDIDFKQIWDDFDEGKAGYISKYQSMDLHLMEITFDNPDKKFALFSHEAVYKTIKGYYHELKHLLLSDYDYQQSGPIFLYEIGRGSAQWSFVGELKQLIYFAISLLKPIRDQLWFGTTLSDEELKKGILDNVDKKLSIIERLQKIFPDLDFSVEEFKKIIEARKNKDLVAAIIKMIENDKLRSIKISKDQFHGDSKENKDKLIDIGEIIE
jgi:hypothetical protein